ncbi:MAG: glycoside hydrolase family 88 protein [Filimonas sp.]|nr:glycoside hydrolase family 88 protein [Filimonas sp.]
MKSFLLTTAFITSSITISYAQQPTKSAFLKDNFSFAEKQLTGLTTIADKNDTLYPRTMDKAGNMKGTNKYDWTSGFFAGNLWYTYEYTKSEAIKKEALKWTESLEPVKYFHGHHDVGFMMYCSYGNAYRLTKKAAYKDVLVQTAKSLCTRFNTTVGCIKSWNDFRSMHGNAKYYFPVIIDNMMNLELLFFASKVTGDKTYKDIAIRHAETTMKNHLRKDYSSYHVVCYDTTNGKVLAQETAQGYSDNSMWARGQSWGIYGFTVVYRETKDKRFLETARKMADTFLDNANLPADKVPYWDFNAGQVGYEPSVNSKAKTNPLAHLRDASAAAITSSALFELSTYLGKDGKKYYDAAELILHSLAGDAYRAKLNENANFILMHSVGSIPHGFEVDTPLVYADYYFLEALQRYNNLKK